MSLTRSGEPVTLVVPDRLEEAVAGSGLVRAAAAALLGTRIEQLRVRRIERECVAGREFAQQFEQPDSSRKSVEERDQLDSAGRVSGQCVAAKNWTGRLRAPGKGQ